MKSIFKVYRIVAMDSFDVDDMFEIPAYEQIGLLDCSNRNMEAIGHAGWSNNILGDNLLIYT